jgi:hypothetical protein
MYNLLYLPALLMAEINVKTTVTLHEKLATMAVAIYGVNDPLAARIQTRHNERMDQQLTQFDFGSGGAGTRSHALNP